MSRTALEHQIDKVLAAIESRKRARAEIEHQTQTIMICLPIKSGEPRIPYTIEHEGYAAHFYVSGQDQDAPESDTASYEYR